MSANSEISWTRHTFNAWWGCTKVSEACRGCYAEAWAKRVGQNVWGPHAPRRFFGDAHWREPLRWNAAAEKAGERHRVFCSSMADVFEEHADAAVNAQLDEARVRLWALIEATPSLDWLLLTKRPENIARMLPERLHGARNVWLGTTVENQARADERIPHLLRVPAAVHFLSMEPLLGPVDLAVALRWNVLTADGVRAVTDDDAGAGLAWRAPVDLIIVGGESGPRARPMHPDWARSVRDQCEKAGVAFHFKQWGEHQEGGDEKGRGLIVLHDGRALLSVDEADAETRHRWSHLRPTMMARVGKKRAGRLLDGVLHDAMPEVRS